MLVEEEFYSITREEIRDIVGTTADRMSAVVRARGTGTRCIRNCRGVFFFIFYRKKLVWSLFLCRKIVFVAHFVQESIFHFFGHLFRKKSAFKNHDSSLLTIYVSSCEETVVRPLQTLLLSLIPSTVMEVSLAKDSYSAFTASESQGRCHAQLSDERKISQLDASRGPSKDAGGKKV